MSLLSLFAHILLYFVSIGALLVLFGSVVAIVVWALVRLWRVSIRLFGE